MLFYFAPSMLSQIVTDLSSKYTSACVNHWPLHICSEAAHAALCRSAGLCARGPLPYTDVRLGL